MDRWYDGLADAIFRPFCKSPEKGAIPAVNAMATNDYLHFFVGNKCRIVPHKYLTNPNIDWLWKTTENILSEKGFLC